MKKLEEALQMDAQELDCCPPSLASPLLSLARLHHFLLFGRTPPAGFEPGTFGMRVRCLNQYTMGTYQVKLSKKCPYIALRDFRLASESTRVFLTPYLSPPLFTHKAFSKIKNWTGERLRSYDKSSCTFKPFSFLFLLSILQCSFENSKVYR